MNYILFDDSVRYNLLPFTHTRPVADIRCGILTMRERWEILAGAKTSTLTEPYLQQVFPADSSDDKLFINGAVFATKELHTAINLLQPEQLLVQEGLVLAARVTKDTIQYNKGTDFQHLSDVIEYTGEVTRLQHIWDIFSMNEKAIEQDYQLLTDGKTSKPIPQGVLAANTDRIFIEEGAKVNIGCILNPDKGYIYLGNNSELLEGAMLRGSVALCEGAVVKMGAKVYTGTTIGPGCKVGGEISNVVFFANSNKGHDGYLGNAVIGEWCNLGADTNCSNLKNNYDKIKIWDEHSFKSVQSGLVFCGLLMGDHSKCGINTMFNTGTVVGVSANIFGAGFPEKFIPSFAWGGSDGMTTYKLERAMETAKRMMERRGKTLSPVELKMYEHIFAYTQEQRDMFANQ